MARMPRPSGRKYLYPLHGGPWLVERVFVPAASITVGGLALMGGTPFVCTVLLKQKYANAFTFFLMVVGAILTVSGLIVGCMGWLTNRLGQICPECLRPMDRGAYVCPSCGFRETPRQKERP